MEDEWSELTHEQKRIVARIVAFFELAPQERWPAMMEVLRDELGVDVKIIKRERTEDE